jgi:hypothetical protein
MLGSIAAAEDAAKAARDEVELSRQSFIIEHRAYVTPVEFHFEKLVSVNSGAIAAWKLTPQWRKTGNTPAKQVRHLTSGTIFSKDGVPDNFNFPDHTRPDQTIGKLIGLSFISGPECRIEARSFRDVNEKA